MNLGSYLTSFREMNSNSSKILMKDKTLRYLDLKPCEKRFMTLDLAIIS